MVRVGSILLVALLSACVASAEHAAQPQDLEWRFYGQDARDLKVLNITSIDLIRG